MLFINYFRFRSVPGYIPSHLATRPMYKRLRPRSKFNQAIRALFGGQSSDQGGLQTTKINGLRTCGYNLTFDPENQMIKSLRRKRSSDQAHFFADQTF